MAELAFREDDAPFSGLGFPYAGFEAAIGALKQVGRCLGGIAGEDAVSLRAVALRLRERVLEADNLRHGFRRLTDRVFVFSPHLLSPSLLCAVAASRSFGRVAECSKARHPLELVDTAPSRQLPGSGFSVSPQP